MSEHTRMHAYLRVCARARARVYMCACACVFVCVRVCVCSTFERTRENVLEVGSLLTCVCMHLRMSV